MSPKFLILVSIFWHSLLIGCSSAPLVSPETAADLVREAWQADAHIVWEMEAEVIPVGGPVTVAVWQSGERYRYELLEAPSATMVGEVLIVNGGEVWQYNRLQDGEPRRAEEAYLAPFTDVTVQIEALLAQSPEQATRNTFEQQDGTTAEIFTLQYATDDSLALWRDLDTRLPFRIEATIGGTEISLRARSYEPLVNPPAGLFAPVR